MRRKNIYGCLGLLILISMLVTSNAIAEQIVIEWPEPGQYAVCFKVTKTSKVHFHLPGANWHATILFATHGGDGTIKGPKTHTLEKGRYCIFKPLLMEPGGGTLNSLRISGSNVEAE